MGFVGPILINLWTSSIWGFLQMPLWWPLGNCLCKHAGATQWPLKHAAHLTSLVWVCVLWRPWKLNEAICVMLWGDTFPFMPYILPDGPRYDRISQNFYLFFPYSFMMIFWVDSLPIVRFPQRRWSNSVVYCMGTTVKHLLYYVSCWLVQRKYTHQFTHASRQHWSGIYRLHSDQGGRPQVRCTWQTSQGLGSTNMVCAQVLSFIVCIFFSNPCVGVVKPCNLEMGQVPSCHWHCDQDEASQKTSRSLSSFACTEIRVEWSHQETYHLNGENDW